jgi:hypothetical protein
LERAAPVGRPIQAIAVRLPGFHPACNVSWPFAPRTALP